MASHAICDVCRGGPPNARSSSAPKLWLATRASLDFIALARSRPHRGAVRAAGCNLSLSTGLAYSYNDAVVTSTTTTAGYAAGPSTMTIPPTVTFTATPAFGV